MRSVLDVVKGLASELDDLWAGQGDPPCLASRPRSWRYETPRQLLLIEGYTDERGTTEYNLALASGGPRRPRSTWRQRVSKRVLLGKEPLVQQRDDVGGRVGARNSRDSAVSGPNQHVRATSPSHATGSTLVGLAQEVHG